MLPHALATRGGDLIHEVRDTSPASLIRSSRFLPILGDQEQAPNAAKNILEKFATAGCDVLSHIAFCSVMRIESIASTDRNHREVAVNCGYSDTLHAESRIAGTIAGGIWAGDNSLRHVMSAHGEGPGMETYDSFAKLEPLLRAGDQGAATEVFRRFGDRLIALARTKLDTRIRRKEDPEEVVQSAYGSFFSRYYAGNLDVSTWDSLWSLLTVITVRKCLNRTEYYLAQCRSVAGELEPGSWDGAAAGLSEAIDREPTPLEAAVLGETVEQMMRGLDAASRIIIERSLQGYGAGEISTQLGVSERKVVRVRRRVKERLQRMQADEIHAV
jgi:RNA polymerase sigma-70 factor (ECF subfamily)